MQKKESGWGPVGAGGGGGLVGGIKVGGSG